MKQDELNDFQFSFKIDLLEKREERGYSVFC